MEKAINDEMSEKEQSFESIRLMELELINKKALWLKKYGWDQSCDFIDSSWRWCKEINGKKMMCDRDEAINIEYNYLSEQ
ncbi:hypothetical protein LCGC14_0878060 [marine sediment metagenome]|uniref:Uncharacterized protein n=1 Tax=marine sediment metagenome TaxID=412755 RepID=A0A0F9P7L5_9ZZZZ